MSDDELSDSARAALEIQNEIDTGEVKRKETKGSRKASNGTHGAITGIALGEYAHGASRTLGAVRLSHSTLGFRAAKHRVASTVLKLAACQVEEEFKRRSAHQDERRQGGATPLSPSA